MDTNPLNIKGQTSDSGNTGQTPVGFSTSTTPPPVPVKPVSNQTITSPTATPPVASSVSTTTSQTTPPPQTSDLEAKKRAALLAMESDVSKKRREAEEKAKKDAENKRLGIVSEEEKAKLEKERIEKEKVEAERKVKDEALKKSISFKRELEDIKTTTDKTLNVRTLKDDMEQLVKERSITTANIALQEERKKQATVAIERTEGKKNWALIIISSLFIVFGLGILGWYLYTTGNLPGFSSTPTTQNPVVNTSPVTAPFIYSDSKKELNITGAREDKILSDIKNEVNNTDVQIGKIEDLLIVNRIEGESVVIKLDYLLSLVKAQIPADLLRTLNQNFSFQIYSSVRNSAILTLETDSYQKAFAGMLSWETLMPKDLYELISGKKYDPEIITGKFEDFTYKNKDARVIRDRNGEIALLYSFLDDKTIIITGNEIAFDEIIARINSPKAVAK